MKHFIFFFKISVLEKEIRKYSRGEDRVLLRFELKGKTISTQQYIRKLGMQKGSQLYSFFF